MIDGTIPVEMQEKYLKIISYEAERLEKLTRGLLTLNELDIQKRMLHIQPFDINSVIKATAASFEGSCTSRNILLELILSGKELMAQADMEQIQQVLYNLLSNAIKFSPDNSTITLETTEKTARSLFLSKIMALEFQRQVSRRSGNDFIRLTDPEAKIKKEPALVWQSSKRFFMHMDNTSM